MSAGIWIQIHILTSLDSKPHLVKRPNSDLHNIIAHSKLSVVRSMDGQGWGTIG
jgi:hypothetical protein